MAVFLSDSRRINEMRRGVLVASLMVGMIVIAGCTPVQKSTAAGSAAGSATGAVIGHASSIGSGPGAIIGLALGTAGGAIAADHYYETDDSGELAEASAAIDGLSGKLEAKDARLAELAAALEREKAQQKALLQAYEKARQGHKTLQTGTPANVQVTKDSDAVTFTILSKVLFRSGKATISSEGRKALASAAQIIRKDYPGAEIEVRGHTDNVPIRYSPYKSNWELSRARALAVVKHLVKSEGFDSAQLKTTGFADTRPVASNKTAAGRQRNRRAEIVVLLRGTQVADGKAAD
jgi:flagellar motor protein MotB